MWLLLLLAACPSQDVDCDLMAVPSVTVDLVAEEGGDLDDVEVIWSMGGGVAQRCESWETGRWVCGWEVAGEITVLADGWGFGPASETVTVEQDVCHVVTQAVELVMPPPDCAAVELPGVLLEVIDAEGAPIPDAAVAYAPRDEDWAAPEACDDEGEGRFACAWGRAGVIDVEASADGLQPAFAEVDVPTDECGPITQTVTLTLTP